MSAAGRGSRQLHSKCAVALLGIEERLRFGSKLEPLGLPPLRASRPQSAGLSPRLCTPAHRRPCLELNRIHRRPGRRLRRFPGPGSLYIQDWALPWPRRSFNGVTPQARTREWDIQLGRAKAAAPSGGREPLPGAAARTRQVPSKHRRALAVSACSSQGLDRP